MHVAGRQILDEFASTHADARPWVENWIATVEKVRWRIPQDIRCDHASASFLAGNVVIFNVKGNRYSLEVRVAYNTGVVVVRWAGTHAAYDKRRN
jgi:mRNA interferase HigB